MVLAKTYLIPVDEGDLESLVDRCLDRAFKKRTASVPVINDASEPDVLLTPEETADLLKVSKVTIWQWSKKGILLPRRIGNQVRYLRSEVLAATRPVHGKGQSA